MQYTKSFYRFFNFSGLEHYRKNRKEYEMKKVFHGVIRISLISIFTVSICFFNLAYLKAEDTEMEYIEYYEESSDGEMIITRIPKVEDPCQLRGTAKEDAAEFVDNYYSYLDGEINDGKEVIESINSGNFTNMKLLGHIIGLSLYKWSCENGFLKRNTQNSGFYFFKKDTETGKGIFLGIRGGEYLPYEGVRKGIASLNLYETGPYMDMYSLMVAITELNADPNEKPGSELDGEAQKMIEEIVEFSHNWALEYYTEIMDLAEKKQK